MAVAELTSFRRYKAIYRSGNTKVINITGVLPNSAKLVKVVKVEQLSDTVIRVTFEIIDEGKTLV
jgi:hypothetical protein